MSSFKEGEIYVCVVPFDAAKPDPANPKDSRGVPEYVEGRTYVCHCHHSSGRFVAFRDVECPQVSKMFLPAVFADLCFAKGAYTVKWELCQ